MKQDKPFKTRHLHNPDVLDTEKESIFDMHEDMKTVDAIPVEELNEQVKDERHKHHTKNTSSSEKRYE
ncbi:MULTISPECIES: hypothetical protein [Bacillales]|uniref:YfhD family protein n=1 Tax=Lysinibacillus louembei TaxID=1470088 RepID=A0ABZ0RYZ6_9BACI|nr:MULTISPECIES: hypothetical protein [Bacillales]MCT6924183.1 hypothetical protein [Metasolibacillus sp.]MCT6940290.1 hypothetical protein [Metasolibacillus sp.]WPK12158.1 hypothetical protein R6U77_00270 [Lysinibacillus louembei]